MHVGTPEIRTGAAAAEYRVPYSLGPDPATLWFRVPPEFGWMLSERVDAALLALLVPGLCVGGTLRVDGPVTAPLVDALRDGYVDLLRGVVPRARPLTVEAADPVAPGPRAPGVLTALSGGVDSFAVLAEHAVTPRASADEQVTHLVFSDVLAHYERAVIEDKRRRLAPVAARLGLPFVPVDSNLPSILRSFGLTPFQTNSPVNAAVAYLLQRGIGTLLLGSSIAGADLARAPGADIADLDPIALPMISTDAMQLRSVGSELRRIDKYERILAVPGVEDALDVCITQHLGGNCSQCWKCLRTQAGMEIVGVRDRFDAVFDRAIWARRRRRYLRSVQRMDSVFAWEIVDEARARGIRLPRPYPFHLGLAKVMRRRR